MKDEEELAPDSKHENQEKKNNDADKSEEKKEENGEQKQNNQESKQDGDENRRKEEQGNIEVNAGRNAEDNKNVAEQKENLNAQKENAKKGKDQLKVILPPQNPEGPGERGEAVQIKDPDPDTKAKIGTTFRICVYYEHYHMIGEAFLLYKNNIISSKFFYSSYLLSFLLNLYKLI